MKKKENGLANGKEISCNIKRRRSMSEHRAGIVTLCISVCLHI